MAGGNRERGVGDWWGMDCRTTREAISTHLDGEPTQVSSRELDAHLRACPACAGWRLRAEHLHRLTRVAPADEVPDLSAQIMAAGPRSGLAGRRTRALRRGVGLVAGIHLGLAVTMALTGGGDDQLLAWSVAAAAGMAAVAARPVRVVGVLPVMVCHCVLMTALLGPKLTGPGVALSAGVVHLVAMSGEVLLFLLWRACPDIDGPRLPRGPLAQAFPAHRRRRAA